jgi:hypothetical protein
MYKYMCLIHYNVHTFHNRCKKQGRKRTLDTPKRMIERREREGE